MKARLLEFIEALRQAGIEITVAENLDAARAAAVAGIERETLRECLAATLVKDHDDRLIFDDTFERFFAVPGEEGKKKRQKARRGSDGSGGEGHGAGRAAPREGARGGEDERRETRLGMPRAPSQRLANRRALLARPFREMDPREIEEVRDLVAELGQRFRSRWARRLRRAPRGRLDMRRTIRRATTRGGVPLELLYRRRRPGKSDLLALVDLSFSTATAAEFLLTLLAPARHHFRRVTLCGYVDAVAEISYEGGHIVPHEPLDLNARSDFGRVLRQIHDHYAPTVGRNTLMLVLGDARNNRRPPRADLLATFRERVRALVWLNPETPERWNTGDSVMATYARHCGQVLSAHNLRTLLKALGQLARTAA